MCTCLIFRIDRSFRQGLSLGLNGSFVNDDPMFELLFSTHDVLFLLRSLIQSAITKITWKYKSITNPEQIYRLRTKSVIDMMMWLQSFGELNSYQFFCIILTICDCFLNLAKEKRKIDVRLSVAVIVFVL